MTEEELIAEHQRLLDAFVASKAHRAEDPETYAAAKREFSQFRTFWRQIGEALDTVPVPAHVLEVH